MRTFRDRREAGGRLAAALERYAGRPDVMVLAPPRGGVPVGYEIAIRLGVSLDVIVVRKLGVPQQTELAMGAIASGGIELVNRRITAAFGLGPEQIAEVITHERAELARRERVFRGDRPPIDVRDQTVILVDDGVATGATMVVAVDAIRTRDPEAIVVAVPVGPPEACEALAERADQIICLVRPRRMYAVGMMYEEFSQTDDAEVRELLDAASCDLRARREVAAASVPP
jgi:predicted phosphoribosyltransferase